MEITLLEGGRDALEATRTPLEKAMQQHFTSRLDADQLSALRGIIHALFN